MKNLQLPKARLKLAKAKLNLLQLEFRENPNNFKVWSYTLEVNALRLYIEKLKNSIVVAKSLKADQ